MGLSSMYVWDIEDEAVTSAGYESAIRWTPIDQAWEDYNLIDDARIFWEESCSALAEGYDPSFRAELPKLRWRGMVKPSCGLPDADSQETRPALASLSLRGLCALH